VIRGRGLTTLLCGAALLAPALWIADDASATPAIGPVTMAVPAPDGGPAGPFPSTWGISCPASGICVAVGAGQNGDFIDSLSGGVWASISAPSVIAGETTILDAVSCAAVGECSAVGEELNGFGVEVPLVETLVAGIWTPSEPPNAAGAVGTDTNLSAVDCPSPTSCVALGTIGDFGFHTTLMTETESAGSWTADNVSASQGNSGNARAGWGGLSCPVAGACTAVGSVANGIESTPIADVLVGGAWTSQDVASANAALLSVSCASPGACEAVGYYEDSSNKPQSLAAADSGGVWTTTEPPPAAGTSSGALQSVDCPTAGTCYAVGSVVPFGHGGALIDTLADGTWTSSLGALPGGAILGTGGLAAVACAGVGECEAVGDDNDNGPLWQAIDETLSDGTWTSSQVQLPGNADTAPPEGPPGPAAQAYGYAVTCPGADSCVSLGRYSVETNQATASRFTEPASYVEMIAQLPTRASSTSVAASADSVTYDTPVTYTATVSGTDGGGTVAFSDAGRTIEGCAAQQLTQTGVGLQASCHYAKAQDGSWITAYYQGDAATFGSDASLVESVTGSYQTITFTSTPPPNPVIGQTYLVTSTGGGSGNPVTIATGTPAVCTVSGSTVSFVGLGNCSIEANQAGAVGYFPANTASQSVTVGAQGQVITFTSAIPSNAEVGGTYLVSATGGDSGNPVVFTSPSAGVCKVSGATAAFIGIGTCSVEANQAGAPGYYQAATAEQDVPVGPSSTKTLLSVGTNVAFGAENQLTFQSTVTANGGVVPVGTVGIRDGAGSLCGAKLSVSGTGQCELTRTQLTPGKYDVWSAYGPTSDLFQPSRSSMEELTVSVAPTSISASMATVEQSKTSWSLRLAARLISSVTDRGLAGQHLRFAVPLSHPLTCTADTSHSGAGSCTLRGTGSFARLDVHRFRVTYAKTQDYKASSATGVLRSTQAGLSEAGQGGTTPWLRLLPSRESAGRDTRELFQRRVRPGVRV